MGHIRLGRLPRTKTWKQVVSLLSSESATPEDVGRATLEAAQGLFGKPIENLVGSLASDPGLLASFYVLAQIAFRAREQDFLGALRQQAIQVPEDDAASAMTFVARVSETARRHVAQAKNPTVFSEIAVLSLREVLSEAVVQHSRTLFGADVAAVQAACRRYATPSRFGRLARDFFGRFLYRTLAFFISKEIHKHVGPGQRFTQLSDLDGFDDALQSWCRERAKIVQSFAGGWTSKENYQSRVHMDSVKRFVPVAVRKLGEEILASDRGGPAL